MRYYIPLRVQEEKTRRSSSAPMIPLWVWIVLLAFAMLVVLALR